jgi:D-proline reductase (dithiol) PrdB
MITQKKEGAVMSIDLEEFKTVYGKWVKENLPDWKAGKIEDAVKKYPFVVSEDVPWTPFKGQPSEKTIALVTSGGLYLKDSQPAFEAESIHGDPSYREIPRTVRPEDLGIAHPHFDHSLAEQDVNTIFPIQRLVELEKEGTVGKVADTHYSFSYVNDVARLLTESVPKVIARLQSERVGMVFLVPV